MPQLFVPLNAKLIDEGVFIDDLNKELAEVQNALVRFVEEHGHAADGAVAKVKCEIAIKCTNTDDKGFVITAGMKNEMPARPKTVSMAMGGPAEDLSGQMALFVRAAGSDANNPAQQKLCTQDGRTIDPETGEAEPEHATE